MHIWVEKSWNVWETNSPEYIHYFWSLNYLPKLLRSTFFFCISSSTIQFSSLQLLSCLTLCDPMNRSTPGLPVHHQLPEFTQTHIHRVSDTIQPSHPLSSPFPPAPEFVLTVLLNLKMPPLLFLTCFSLSSCVLIY